MDDWELATITYQPNVVITPMESRPDPPGLEGIVADLTDSEAFEKVVFFKAPKMYLGNMLTAYGGNLNYTIFYTTGIFGMFYNINFCYLLKCGLCRVFL